MAAKRVTPEEVKEFFRLYEKYGTFAEVARRTGRSASTVSRYCSQKRLSSLKIAARQEF